MSKKRYPKPPRRVAWDVDPNRPVTPNMARHLDRIVKSHHGDPETRRPDRPTNNGGLRMVGWPDLMGDHRKAATMNRPPKGDGGCTVKTLDFRTPKSPERNAKV